MLDCSRRYPRSSRTGDPVGGKLPVNLQIGAYYPFMPYKLSALVSSYDTIGIILTALNVSLHIARRHQPHRVAQHLKLAAPMMCRRTGLNADQAVRQSRKELHYWAGQAAGPAMSAMPR
jgi:hypothetical protein